LLQGREGKEALQHAEQMVMAARPNAWPGFQELIAHGHFP
jgi:hypothetical protein